MTSTSASDEQHQDFGAIEAAVKETARGRAFLANYARRVQQSDTLTMLAMLSRLERLSDDLASRIAELEAGRPRRLDQPVPRSAGYVPQGSALVPAHDGAADTMRRIDELASVLGDLHRQAVQLASQCVGIDGRGSSETFVEIDAHAFTSADPAMLSSRSADDEDHADNEVLGKIARALEP